MLPSSLVNPQAPATGSLLILSSDSFVSTVLYRPGGSADAPAFAFTSTSEGKHITLHHGGATGPVAGELILHGFLKKGVGMVKLAGGDEMKVEQWARITRGGVAVTIHGSEYVWTKVVEKDSKDPNALKAPYYEAVSGTEIAAKHVPLWSEVHANDSLNFSGTRVLTRAHIWFASEVDEKAVPGLLLSLSLFRYLDLKNSSAPTHSSFATQGVIQGIYMSCPVQ